MYYRISKYDPRFQIDGVHSKDEWTSFSDIGCAFNGEILTVEQYIETENSYLSCVESILLASRVSALTIFCLENYEALLCWKNGDTLAGDMLRDFLRDGLREKCWARLSGSNVYLDFGYDYYLHIGCPLEWPEMEKIVHAHDLFFELWDSPEDLLD